MASSVQGDCLAGGEGESNAKSMQTRMSVFHLKRVQEKESGIFSHHAS